MTIHWEPDAPTNPNSIDVWWVAQGNETYIGAADVSGVAGMPDKVGGVLPDAARVLVADYYNEQQNAGVLRDILAMDYERGPP